LRVSGTPGTAYEGTYNTREEIRTVQGIVADEPTDYDANIEGVDEATLTAVFQKTQPGAETLKVEIVSDDQVIAGSATAAEFGEVTVKWPSETESKGTMLPHGAGSILAMVQPPARGPLEGLWSLRAPVRCRRRSLLRTARCPLMRKDVKEKGGRGRHVI
jgi:hypothetical protein